jgi:antitoxin ParD1/3/4
LLSNQLATFANFEYGWQNMATMNISLTPQLEKLVNDRVESGLYTSASEVIREALRLLDSRDRGMNHQLRTDVEAGLRQLEVGQSRPFDEDAVERIKKAGRAKLAALKARKP